MYDPPIKSKAISSARQKMIDSVQPLVDEYLEAVKALNDLGDMMFVPECGKPGKGFKALHKVTKDRDMLLRNHTNAIKRLESWIVGSDQKGFTAKSQTTRCSLVLSLLPGYPER